MTPLSATQRRRAVKAGTQLAGQLAPKPGETYTLPSRSRHGKSYEMIAHPEGGAVHQGEGCEGEIFNGVRGCWHARETGVIAMTTAVTTYDPNNAAVTARTITDEDVAVLKTTICRGATDAELNLFVATCRHTGLDPFMKQIHAVFRNTKVGDKWVKVMSIQVGIDGYRLIAERTGLTQGMDGPQWSDDGVNWVDFPFTDKPKFARVGVYRKDVERPFVAVCRWGAYAQYQGDKLTSMWARMGAEQLAKCAEALGLRRAYPAEMAALPLAPDYIDTEELEAENRSFVPASDAIEGESRAIEAPVEDEIPDDAPFAPEEEPEAPAAEPASEPVDLASIRKQILAVLTDCKATWSPKDYADLYRSLLRFMPEGETKFEASNLTAETAAACLTELRQKRGEPVTT